MLEFMQKVTHHAPNSIMHSIQVNIQAVQIFLFQVFRIWYETEKAQKNMVTIATNCKFN